MRKKQTPPAAPVSLQQGLDAFYAAQAAPAATAAPGNRPWSRKIKSVALAVHPSQVAEATADAAARGVPTAFTRDGRPVFEGRGHRKRYMAAYGFYDRDAGYGDQAPQNLKGRTPPPNKLREIAARLADRIRCKNSSFVRPAR